LQSDTPEYFIGYRKLEELVAAHTNRSQPFYAELLTRRISGEPIGCAEMTIVVQDFDDAGRVRYCRLPAGEYDLIYGAPFDEGKARRLREAAVERFEAALGYLTSAGFKVERATIAIPRDLILLSGTADLLEVSRTA
jgi:hypothetical protein